MSPSPSKSADVNPRKPAPPVGKPTALYVSSKSPLRFTLFSSDALLSVARRHHIQPVVSNQIHQHKGAFGVVAGKVGIVPC